MENLVKRDIMTLVEDLSMHTTVMTVVVLEQLQKMLQKIREEEGVDRENIENQIRDKRKEYEGLIGTKPFMGRHLAELERRIEQYKLYPESRDRLNKPVEVKSLATKKSKWKKKK